MSPASRILDCSHRSEPSAMLPCLRGPCRLDFLLYAYFQQSSSIWFGVLALYLNSLLLIQLPAWQLQKTMFASYTEANEKKMSLQLSVQAPAKWAWCCSAGTVGPMQHFLFERGWSISVWWVLWLLLYRIRVEAELQPAACRWIHRSRELAASASLHSSLFWNFLCKSSCWALGL